MTTKILAALLALVVSMVANAPGRLPASGAPSLATAGTNSHSHQIASAAEPGEGVPAGAGIDIAEWLERAEEEMNAGVSAWSQFDFSTLDLPIGASSRVNGERTDEPWHALFASRSFDESFESFESFDNPEQLIRLAALGPSLSNPIPGGYGQRLGAFDSLAGSAGGSGRGIGGGATGGGSSGGADNQGSKQEGSSPTTVPTEPPMNPPVPDDQGPKQEDSSPTTVPTVTEFPMSPPVADDPGSKQEGSSPPIVPTVTEFPESPPVSVPEPASMGLLGLGLIGLGLARRRRAAVRV